ncbi:UNVERIFIED_CONTAM: hypothetical protein FKN15_040751 [Acipenser sinensis]
MKLRIHNHNSKFNVGFIATILLNYLPTEQAIWDSFLKKQREIYTQFLREMIIQPGIAKANLGFSREDVTLEDHPLNPNPDSQWNTYFKDNEILLQIDKDVRRLYPDMAFFQRPTEYPCLLILDPQNEYETLRRRVEQTSLKAQTVARNRSGVTNVSSPGKAVCTYPSNEYEVLPSGSEAHWEVVERILFIYAKLNPGIAYVQGMNEVVGPIYYTFATDPNTEWKEHAEADTFFCFTSLMSENRDNFIKSLDDSQCGITYKMESVYSTLKQKDAELYLKLQEQNIKPQYFTFRWLTLLLSQEFLLPDVIRIWDSLFSDQERFDFLILVCCAMLVLIRDQLLAGDFTVNMRLLQAQRFPVTLSASQVGPQQLGLQVGKSPLMFLAEQSLEMSQLDVEQTREATVIQSCIIPVLLSADQGDSGKVFACAAQ